MKEPIQTAESPSAIGVYSQGIRIGKMVYLSGQIPLDLSTGGIISDDIRIQIETVFTYIKKLTEASGGSLDSIVKLTIYLIDLNNFPLVNEIMKAHFKEPYPARATVEVKALPKGAQVEIDAI